MEDGVAKSVEPTFPCKVCGRHFIRSSLQKHEPACKKLTQAHRKVFDSGKQRASGSDIPLKDIQRARKEKEKHGGTFPRPKTQWRERHQEFLGAVKAGKQVDLALKTGGPLPPPPHTSVPKDYVQCTYCGRNFAERAADRHIAFCKEQQSRKALVQTTGSGSTTISNKTPSTSSSKSLSRQSSKSQQDRETPKSTATKASNPPSRRSSKDRISAGVGSVTIGGAMIGELGQARRSLGEPNAVNVRVGEPKKASVGSRGRQTPTSTSSHLPQPARRNNSAQRGSNTAAVAKADQYGSKTQ